jgi:hypothetical protein
MGTALVTEREANGSVPIFLRIGDGAEHRIGRFAPDVDPVTGRASFGALAALLRDAAADIDGEGDGSGST